MHMLMPLNSNKLLFYSIKLLWNLCDNLHETKYQIMWINQLGHDVKNILKFILLYTLIIKSLKN